MVGLQRIHAATTTTNGVSLNYTISPLLASPSMSECLLDSAIYKVRIAAS